MDSTKGITLEEQARNLARCITARTEQCTHKYGDSPLSSPITSLFLVYAHGMQGIQLACRVDIPYKEIAYPGTITLKYPV